MAKPKISIVEVGPRDGFQNLPEFLPTEKKLAVIDRIIAAGVTHMQITSFVSPKYVPQMADAREVFQGVRDYLEEKGVDNLL